MALSALRFARELARFEERIAGLVEQGHYDSYAYHYWPVAVTLKRLLNDLVELDEALADVVLPDGVPSVPEIVAGALATYNDLTERAKQEAKSLSETRQAEREEAERRHELAVTVECPFCGAQPGQSCRTTSGRGGKQHPKGIDDHRDRFRAATDPEWKDHAEAGRAGDGP